jgi:hypothetical protein
MSKRFTLTLPSPIYEELREQAKKHDRSIRDIVTMCLKFGLIAIKVEEDPDSELYYKEKILEDGKPGTKETRFQIMW